MKTQPSNTSVMLLYWRYYWVPLYEVLPKCFQNLNATRKLLVVQLCITGYYELYPLWIILPSGVLLWEHVCFLCAFLWRHVSAVLRSYWPAKMTYVKEEWICIKFCFKLSKTASEIHRMLKEALGQTQTYEQFKRFKNGRMSVNDEEHSGRPSTGTTTENMAKVWYWRHSAWGIRSTRTDGEWKILLRSSEAVEVTTSSANIQTSGATTPGPSIMTMLWLTRHSLCSSFWRLRIQQSSPILPTHRTSPPCDFFLFPKMKLKLKRWLLTALKRSRLYRRMWWRRWHEVTYRSASDHGNPAGITFICAKGDYLKGMGANRNFGKW